MNQTNLSDLRLPQNPVFVVGYPRSGTTLLLRLLVTQPGFYSFPETHYFSVIEKHVHSDVKGNVLSPCLDVVFQKILEKDGIAFNKEEREILYAAAENKTLTSKQLFELLVTRFLLNYYPGIKKETSWRWIEKTPTHANFLNRILELYPQAQIIHIRRHPVPAVFSRKLKFPFNKNKSVSELAYAWNRLEENIQISRKRYPASIYTLRYEDLVQKIEIELNKAADFLNTRFNLSLTEDFNMDKISDPLILPFETWKQDDKNQAIKNTNEFYKNRIDRTDVETIERITGNMMKQSGYGSFLGTHQP